ncbi:MAG TPA: aldo/keto reductase [Terriglobales bacterium]|nr:aldo/keto reductase [Terriglobales bacterium]
MSDLRPLGRTSIPISSIGLGCWQFSQGAGLTGGFWPALAPETVDAIVAASLAAGVNWFDTAEKYGDGLSEQALARALVAAGRANGDVVIATKWWPLLRTARSIGATIAERRARLAPFGIDLHQVHWPLAFAPVAAQMNAMADLVEAGAIRAVGVSNFSVAGMREAHRALARRGLRLASNQVHYNLLDRRIERNGVLRAARELGVTIIAYSPLAQGILSGKYHRDPNLVRSWRGLRRWMARLRHPGLEESRPVVEALETIASARGASPSQVALSWLVHARGDLVTAIPGASSPAQARENAGAMELRLDEGETKRLDELSRQFA